MRADSLDESIYLDDEKAYGFVLYTDGGCRPSRGDAGWGVHGYSFDLSIKNTLKGKTDVPTNQGYLDFEVFRGTKANIVTPFTYIDGMGTIQGEGTNNIAELTALLKSFGFIDRCNLKKGVFLLDSEYVIKGLKEYLAKWKYNGWVNSRGEDVSNRTYWEQIDQYHQRLIEKGFEIEFDWVKGHEDKGNIHADALATKAVFARKNGHHIEEDFLSFTANNKYWNPTFSYHRLFAKQRWYFTSGQDVPLKTEDGFHIYCTGSHGKDDETGKPISDLNFGVLYLKEKEPMIELIQTQHNKRCDTTYLSTVVGRLDTLLLPRVYTELLDYQDKFIYKSPERNELYLSTGEPLTMEVNPPRRVAKQNDMFNLMISKLNDYRAGKLLTTDITDMLFKTETMKSGKKQGKICDDIKRVAFIRPPVKYHLKDGREKWDTITLTIGIDLPVRNVIQGIAGDFPKIEVVTWRESDLAFRYGVVISLNGDIGFWTGFYSNLKIIKK